jgi:hypothetical protein
MLSAPISLPLAATLALGSIVFLTGPARADAGDDAERPFFDLDLYRPVLTQPPPAEPPASPTDGADTLRRLDAASTRESRFGKAGSRWWSIGPGIANDFDGSTDVNAHGIFSQFLADDLEFGVEAAGWYFNQEGQDTGGLSGTLLFRWHFVAADDYRWSVFTDAGIGLLGAFDEVPDEGTGFAFLPRLGLGFTHALDSDSPDGSRLTLGLRWHHISNARINGNERNPARDGLMFYAEIQFPF